jgi:hypothetical protein
MLKVTYTETGLYLEHLNQPVEKWIGLRAILAVRAGHRLVVEQSTASFLLLANSTDLPGLKTALAEASLAREESVTLSIADAEWLEVTLKGTWVSSGTEAEGVFVAMLSPRIEFLLFQIWRDSQVQVSSIGRQNR